MDFFEAQDHAHRRTRVLLLLFVAALLGITLTLFLAAKLFILGSGDVARGGQPIPDRTLFIWIAAGVTLFVGAVSLFHTRQLRAGGAVLIGRLGGRPLRDDDPAERRLQNIVEEMAIASGVPVPFVSVLDEEKSINAFAAGYTIHDANVAVTRGTLELLDRDELQGVIAHEFSHILNGDMRLNIRLIGLLQGLLALALLGRRIMGSVRYSSSRGRGRGGAVLLGAALFVTGSIGVLAGKLIKAAVSRQREFLADASAVQFTRNPGGVTGALKKIGGYGYGSRIAHSRAEELSHLYFANGLASRWLSTHPPLDERIRRIDSRFDGTFPKVERPAAAQAAERAEAEARSQIAAGALPTMVAGAFAASAAELVAQVGAPTRAHLSYAQRLLASFPEELRTAAHEPQRATALVCALLLERDPQVAATQRALTAKFGGEAFADDVVALAALVRAQGPTARLPLLDLLLPALMRLTPAQREAFRPLVHELIHADRQVRVFELALVHVLARHLVPAKQRAGRAPGRVVHAYAPFREHFEVLLSAMARAGHENELQARAAFQAAQRRVTKAVGPLALQATSALTLPRVQQALVRLQYAAPVIRKRLVEACAYCATYDGTVRIEEAELLRAIGEAIDCPVPPLQVQVAREAVVA